MAPPDSGPRIPAGAGHAGSKAAVRPSPAKAGTGPVQVFLNTDLKGIGSPAATGLRANDGTGESVASDGAPNVLYTMNDNAAVSTDYGSSFRGLNPASVFPTPPRSGGFCCNQNVAYSRVGNVFVWVLQYWPGKTGNYSAKFNNVIRIATATKAQFAASGGTAWRYYDFFPKDFGVKKPTRGNTLNRPQLAVAGGDVYLSLDVWSKAARSFQGSVMARFSANQLAAQGSLGYQYFRAPSAAGALTPAQNAGSAGGFQYFGGAATTTRLDVFRWDADANAITLNEVDHSPVPIEGTEGPGQSGFLQDYGVQAGTVMTGARRAGQLAFGWSDLMLAPVFRGGSVQTVEVNQEPGLGFLFIDASGDRLTASKNLGVHEEDRATAIPQLRASKKTGDFALSFMQGNNPRPPQHFVGFLTNLTYVPTVIGTQAAFPHASGNEFVGLASLGTGSCFIAAGAAPFGNGQAPASVHPHYVVFGRSSSHCRPPGAGPDLVIESITGGGGTAQITVKNVGLAAAGPSRLGYSLAGQAAQQADTPGLSPGVAATVSVPCSGQVTVAAAADATGLVAERNETNNGRQQAVDCSAATGAPDLVITSISGGSDSIQVVVHNAGSGAAGPSRLGYSFDGGSFAQADTPAIAAGGSTTVDLDCPGSGAISVDALADDTALVAESNESNNERTDSVTCQVTTAQPDLVITNVTVIRGASADTFGAISVDVKNVGTAAAAASRTRIAEDGGATTDVATPALAPDQTVNVRAACTEDSSGATATADVFGEVAESNEANNVLHGSSGVSCYRGPA